MSSNNSKTKFTIFFSIVLIIAVISIILSIINLFLLLKTNSETSDDYIDSVQAAAYIPPESSESFESVETTEIISGTVSFTESQTQIQIEEPLATVGRDDPGATLTEQHEQLFVVTPSGRRYHYPTCGSARNISRYISKEEAEQSGYTPCGTCKPG